MALTEHEKEFILELKNEFMAWGIGADQIEDETLKEIVIDSYDEDWHEFTKNLALNFERRDVVPFDLAHGDVMEIFHNAGAFSEFRLSNWVD